VKELVVDCREHSWDWEMGPWTQPDFPSSSALLSSVFLHQERNMTGTVCVTTSFSSFVAVVD